MKKFWLISTILTMLFIPTMISCKGKSAKQAGETLYKEYQRASESNGVKSLKNKERIETVKEIYHSVTQCGTCNGSGVVLAKDEYGNAITDYNGYYQSTTCPSCGGNGEY